MYIGSWVFSLFSFSLPPLYDQNHYLGTFGVIFSRLNLSYFLQECQIDMDNHLMTGIVCHESLRWIP